MGDWGRLDRPPAEHGWEFPPDEYRRRVDGIRRRMVALGVDCLFLTSDLALTAPGAAPSIGARAVRHSALRPVH